MATDGSIVIGTELSTDKFDKQASELDNKIKKEEQKKIIIEAKMQLQEQDLEEAIRKTDELAEAYQNLKSLKEKANAGKMTPGDFEAMHSLQNQYGTLEKIDGLFQKSLSKQDALQLKVQETKNKYESINNEIDKYKQKLAGINIQKQKAEVDQLKESVDKVGSSFSGAVKKAGKLALAIFGIRGAYMLLRRASSELSGYDEQYATNLEYIRYVLTQAIAPVLKYIVNLAMQLLSWINAILQAWFGINLFANGSVESFQKMKKGASGVEKAVKQIKKQLLGFDEVNMLTDQSDTGTSAGAGGVGAVPEMDLSAWQGKVPDWLQWIIDNKDTILTLLAGVLGFITAIKLGLGGIKALGIGILVAGVAKLIQGIIAYIKNPCWYNFLTILQGIALIVAGIAILMGGWVVALIAVGVAIVTYLIQNWDKVKEILGIVGEWIYSHVIKPVGDFFSNLWKSIKDWAINAWNGIKNAFSAMGSWIYGNIIQPVGNYFSNMWTNLKNGAINAWNGIKNTFNTVGKFFKDVFSNAWQAVKNVFSTGGKIFDGIKEGIVTSFKNIVNAIIRGINKVIANPFNAINNVLSRITGIEIFGAKPFSFIHIISVPEIPQLKSGGIINMPNKGTLLGAGNALGGEAGREGVVPLTDQQAMAELGREIGKNVLVNLTNITQMNGRVISRELKQVRSTQEFAYNM